MVNTRNGWVNHCVRCDNTMHMSSSSVELLIYRICSHNFRTPIFKAFLEGFPHLSQPSILHLGMVTHSYCRNCSLSLLLSFRNVGFQLFSSEHYAYIITLKCFKFINRIPNSRHNPKVTSKTTPYKNSSN
jgi:hypothetical protein